MARPIADYNRDWSHLRNGEPLRQAVIEINGVRHEVPVYKASPFGLLVDHHGLIRWYPQDWEVKA